MKAPRVLQMADTSVLIAASVRSHPRHQRAAAVIAPLLDDGSELAVSAHSLLETYAALSVLPVAPRLSPAEAGRIVERIRARAHVIALSGAEYAAVVEHCIRLGLSGGIVYDALHAAAARKTQVQQFWTFNPGDFHRVWPDAGNIIAEP